MSDEEGFRPVPKHIDRSERIGEIALIFAFVFFVLRIPVVLALNEPDGTEVWYLTLLAIGCSFLYHKATVDEKPGFILHKGYRLGMTVRGLITLRIKRLVK